MAQSISGLQVYIHLLKRTTKNLSQMYYVCVMYLNASENVLSLLHVIYANARERSSVVLKGLAEGPLIITIFHVGYYHIGYHPYSECYKAPA